MKKILMSVAVVSAMFFVSSCACCNNSENAAEAPAATECSEQPCDSAKCAGCEKAAECEKACCDSTSTDCNKTE